MSSNIRTEDENRKTVREDLKKNLFIEAGAGAGKTTLLVARAVNLLTQDDVDPSQVVIITFTNAAASELYERIVNELRSRRKQAEESHDTKQAEKLKNVLDHIDRMDISTIHHFCNAMLQQRIFDAQLGMNTEYAEEEDVTDAKKTFLRDLLGGRTTEDEQEKQKIDQDLRKLKDVLGYGYRNQIEDLFCKDNMADQEDAVYVVNEEVLKDSWDEYKKHAYDILRKVLNIGEKYEDSIWDLYQRVPLKSGNPADHKKRDIYGKISSQSNVPEEEKKLLLDEIRVAVEKYEHGDDSYVIPMVKKLKGRDDEKGVKQTYIFAHAIGKMATKTSFPKDQQSEFGKLKKAWSDEAKDADDEIGTVLNSDFNDFRNRAVAYQTGLVVKFVAECAKEYQAKRDSSTISNDTLLYRTRDLLKEEQARKILSDRYRYLFVDEYQDTDHLQTDIIWNLCRKEDNPDELRDGSLVIVGDPKQSIYRFRGADATLFEKMKDRFAKLQRNDPDHNEVIVLHDNYRSNPDIIAAVNDKFKADFNSQAKAEDDASDIKRDDPAYEEMNAGKAREEAGMPDDTLHGVFGCYLENQKTEAEKAAEKLAKKNKTATAVQDDKKKEDDKKLFRQKLTDLIWDLCHQDVKIMVKGENGYEKRKIRYSDILVLTWKKSEVGQIVGALKQHHIPVNAMGDINISTTPMKALIRIMKYLANPNDAITKALAASAIYGGVISNIPAEEYEKLTGQLYALRDLIRNAQSYENLKDDNQRKKEFQADCEKYGLYDLHEISGHRDACSIIRYLINHTDLLFPCHTNTGKSGETEESEPFDYDQRKQFNNLAEAMEQEGIYDLSEAAEYLETYLYAEHEREAELVPGLDQVRVMNAHKAKGLQSPVVIVMNDTRRKQAQNYQEDNRYYMIAGKQKTFVCDEEITEKAELAVARDNLNLNYVVDTRAGEVLILMNKKEPDPKKATSVVLDNPPRIDNWLGGKIEPAPESAQTSEQNIEKADLSDVYERRNDDVKKYKELSRDLYRSIIPSDFENAQTSSGNNEEERVEKEERPTGAVFGTVMHRCFELFVNRRKTILKEKDSSESIQKIISQAVMENISDIEEKDVEKYQKYLTRVLTSFRNNREKMDLIRNAKEVYTEFPFSYYKDKNECEDLLKDLKEAVNAGSKSKWDSLGIDDKDEKQKYYIHGACDLVLKNQNNSITIIDYKSDECHTADHDAFRTKKENTYGGQLTLYKYAMAEVFGVDLEHVDAHLYLVDIES